MNDDQPDFWQKIPPLIAILRGITLDEVDSVLSILTDAGFKLIEVPLNSPDPFSSIARMIEQAPEDVLIGAGTVLEVDDVYRLSEMGAKLIVTPHLDLEVVAATQRAQLLMASGCTTPSEMLSAYRHGVNIVKFFPAEPLGINYFKAINTILPPKLPVFAVGGIDANNLAAWHAAGCHGFGLGSALYQPGIDKALLQERAEILMAQWQQLNQHAN